MSTPDLSEILSAVKETPAAMDMLRGMLAPTGDTGEGCHEKEAEETKSPGIGEWRCLLAALRPFLPEERRAGVDTLLRVLDLLCLAGKLLPEKGQV